MDQDASPFCSTDATSPMMTEPVPDSESDSDLSDILPPPKTSFRMEKRVQLYYKCPRRSL